MARHYTCDLCGASPITPIPVLTTDAHPHKGDELRIGVDLCTPCAKASRLESPRSLDELKRTRNLPIPASDYAD